jgi:hypothetical protein
VRMCVRGPDPRHGEIVLLASVTAAVDAQATSRCRQGAGDVSAKLT